MVYILPASPLGTGGQESIKPTSDPIGALKPAFWPLAAYGNELFTAAVGIAVVAVTSRQLRAKRSAFETGWQVKLGVWSFSFYLVHATVIYLALRLFGYQDASWRNLGWMLAILLVDLLLAWALYRFVEHPVERSLRKWKDARDLRKVEQAALRD